MDTTEPLSTPAQSRSLAGPNGSWVADDGGAASPSGRANGARPATRADEAGGAGRAWGRTLRRSAPRGRHAAFEPSADRPDPVALFESANEGRVRALIPIRFGRMSASPFGFFRGAATFPVEF